MKRITALCLSATNALLVMTATQSALGSTCPTPGKISRPSIGLVLGGGGARGAAHIGVIRKLEELNIPVDYVAGTSMGSLIGALYATGMNAEELEETIRSLDWGDMFNDNTARVDRPFRRKRDDDLNLFGPKLGVGHDSNLLPKGAISGQKISFLFESLVHDRVQVTDFDDLPIPFRAVAADIATGEAVVLDSGNLALAMRSSMSVPGLFDPVELDGHLLVDGGIADNLPIDVVRAMGADRLIVVDVGSPLTPREDLDNLLAVFGQMNSLLIANNVAAQLATLGESDIFIRPDIGDAVSSADFDKSHEAIEIGYDAANNLTAVLSSLSVSVEEHSAHRASIEGCTAPSNVIDFVHLDNQSRFRDAVILERLHVQRGQPLDTAALDADIKQIYALGFLDLVRYEVVAEDGETGIIVHVTQDARGTAFVEWGINYSADDRESQFDILLSYLKTDLDSLGSELRIMTQLGDDPGIMAEVYKPLDTRRRWSVKPKLFADRSDITTYNDDGKALESFQIDQFGGSVYLAREFGRHAALFAGLKRTSGAVDIETGDPTTPKLEFEDGGYFVGFQWDRIDDLYFPTTGVFIDARYNSSQDGIGADVEFDQFNITAAIAETFGRHTFIGLARFATTIDDDAPIYAQFRAGGFTYLSGFNDDELIGQHFGMALLSHRFSLTKSGLLPAYFGTTLEYGNVADERSQIFDDAIFNGSAYLGYHSPIGSFYLGYGFAEGGRSRFFVRIGNVFGRGDIAR